MKATRVHEEHIAVFGESGSGKTVMVSSFYGTMQERPKDSLFHVVADNVGLGNRLYKNYLGMKNSANLPATTHFAATSYSFTVKPKPSAIAGAPKAGPFDDLRVVWHDYPGEWFENDVSGPEEAERRVDAFKALLGSDVALLLVDAQKLIENAGAEELYLKSLLNSFGSGLLTMKNELLTDGNPLDKFPRIWVMALSKSDLLPDMDATTFRELMIEKAADEIGKLREVLEELVSHSEFLAIGEDFLTVSAGSFSPKKIEMENRVGIELILPLAAVFATERKLKWAQVKNNGRQVVKILIGGGAAIISALGGLGVFAAKLMSHDHKALKTLGVALGAFGSGLSDLAQHGVKLIDESNRDALAKQNNLRAMLTGFQLDLRTAENENVLLTSNR